MQRVSLWLQLDLPFGAAVGVWSQAATVFVASIDAGAGDRQFAAVITARVSGIDAAPMICDRHSQRSLLRRLPLQLIAGEREGKRFAESLLVPLPSHHRARVRKSRDHTCTHWKARCEPAAWN